MKYKIGNRWAGKGKPIFLAANIGVNHNGDMPLARQLVEAAAKAGCDSVVLQKCEPARHMSPALQNKMLVTPWGGMTYLDYRRQLELDETQFREVITRCRELGICWGGSVRDMPSLEFIARLEPDYFRIPSAALTQNELLQQIRPLKCPVMLCAGGSSLDQVKRALESLGHENVIPLHGDSDHFKVKQKFSAESLHRLKEELECPFGVSGHELNFATTLAALALGACVVERPITMDHSLWGSNQAMAAQPSEMERLARGIRLLEKGIKGIQQGRVNDLFLKLENCWNNRLEPIDESYSLSPDHVSDHISVPTRANTPADTKQRSAHTHSHPKQRPSGSNRRPVASAFPAPNGCASPLELTSGKRKNGIEIDGHQNRAIKSAHGRKANPKRK